MFDTAGIKGKPQRGLEQKLKMLKCNNLSTNKLANWVQMKNLIFKICISMTKTTKDIYWTKIKSIYSNLDRINAIIIKVTNTPFVGDFSKSTRITLCIQKTILEGILQNVSNWAQQWKGNNVQKNASDIQPNGTAFENVCFGNFSTERKWLPISNNLIIKVQKKWLLVTLEKIQMYCDKKIQQICRQILRTRRITKNATNQTSLAYLPMQTTNKSRAFFTACHLQNIVGSKGVHRRNVGQT